MQKLCFLAFILVLVYSCKPKTQESSQDTVTSFEINQKEWPKKLAIDYKIKPDLATWDEFALLETSFDALYKVENTADLSLVIDDLVEKQSDFADTEYPENFDLPQIKSRLIMFKTFLLKVRGDLQYRLDVQKSTLEMVQAYNAFRNQFNIIANNTLDSELLLLLEEE